MFRNVVTARELFEVLAGCHIEQRIIGTQLDADGTQKQFTLEDITIVTMRQ